MYVGKSAHSSFNSTVSSQHMYSFLSWSVIVTKTWMKVKVECREHLGRY